MNYINTDSQSKTLRERAIHVNAREILIAQIVNSSQEKDLAEHANCEGYGRIRHFRYDKGPNWSANPLPIYPAARALGRQPGLEIRAQVFQNAACNWRCWYCFVDDTRLAATERVARFLKPSQLIEWYLNQENPPDVIDLTGGQPDLTPEWVLWMMEELAKRGLDDKVFLWSDDNLSTYYLWEYLTRDQIDFMRDFRNYSRVACFKGYTPEAFAFNTYARPELFDRQFDVFKRLLKEGFDTYAYVTFTAVPDPDLPRNMRKFVSRLQEIHPNLPLRTVPLEVKLYSPTEMRVKKRDDFRSALEFQHNVHLAWAEELKRRYSSSELSKPITAISMNDRDAGSV